MHELDLGIVDAQAQHLNEVLGDADPRLRRGRFHVVGHRDERGAVRTGALVQHVGNDQWSVYLLNEQQLELVTQRKLAELGRESGGLGHAGTEVATEAGLTLAAHALGPVGMVLGPLAEVASIAGASLGLGGESAAIKIARKLAADGVAPSDVARVAGEVRASSGESAGAAVSGTHRERSADGDLDRIPDGVGALTAASIEPPQATLGVVREATLGRAASLDREPLVDDARKAPVDGVAPTYGEPALTAASESHRETIDPSRSARRAVRESTFARASSEDGEARFEREERVDAETSPTLSADAPQHDAPEGHERVAGREERAAFAAAPRLVDDMPALVKPRAPSRSSEPLGLER